MLTLAGCFTRRYMYFCLYSLYYLLLRGCFMQIIMMDGGKLPKDHNFAMFKVTSVLSLPHSEAHFELEQQVVSAVSLSWCHVIGLLDVCVMEQFDIFPQ